MIHYLIELAVWLLGSYFAGACIGCLLRKWFGADVAAPELTETPAVEAQAAYDAPAPFADVPEVKTSAATPVAALAAGAATALAADVAPQRAPRMERPRGLPAARDGKPDALLRISGVGPKNEKILHSLGYFHFDQIAAWTPENVSWVDDHLKFNGRIDREEWINQARLLADGNEAEFATLYGSGGEGKQETGLRTLRGPRESETADAAESAVAFLTPSADEQEAASGKMRRPKGIAAARGGKADNLQRISGIGPKNETILHSLGFFHFDQISAWTATEVNWVDDHLKFNGRIKREEWIRQARLLAEGKETEFTRLYGSGGLKSRKGEATSGTRTKRT